MKIQYYNKRLEVFIVCVNAVASAAVAASFVMLFGFDKPLLPSAILYSSQASLLCVFIAEKLIRLLNARSRKEFWQANWFEIPLFAGLCIAVFGAGRWFGDADPKLLRQFAIGIYLVVQVISKLCRTSINLAATGRNPMRTLIASFLVLIICGAGLLVLPKSSTGQRIGFVDALFTATSATCVTGLIVKDTGKDFSMMGQIIILSLIQLGGLGIIVFGAVFALLLRQALSVSESVAMQDLLSAQTLGRIGNMITFIFVGTLLIEAVGTISIFGMWDNVAGWTPNIHEQWFYSIFHSISAFCNAGFSLFSDSFIRYDRSWEIYGVICPLIILGGLGFGVLYDLFTFGGNRLARFFKSRFNSRGRFLKEAPKKLRLQSKIVISISILLIIFGTVGILLLELYTGDGDAAHRTTVSGAFFQSVTARTAGFNTIDISSMSEASRLVVISLMFIGGSPGSTAGGIKTVTLAVIIMSVVAALRKRNEVELFNRSIRVVVVGRAITVVLLFIVVLFAAILALSVSENGNGFTMSDISFEAASALGTVGLTTGITAFLTTAGKLIIIAVMLIGRLGPLTLLAALTFNLKPVRYSYPSEAIIVG